MYYENGNRRFSILKMIFICLVIAFFIFLIMWIFARTKQSTSNCSNTTNENTVFNNNINYLQNVGYDYFTTDKLPTEVGQTIIITLDELIKGKYMLQVSDSDGKTCNQEDSYVSVTKTETGYEMKTYLVCGGKSDYVIKVLGCHDLCNNKCNSCPDITEYQFSKTVSKNVTTYACPKGYTKNGKTCRLTKIVDTKNPTVKTGIVTDTKPANKVVVSGTKTKVETIIKTTEKILTTKALKKTDCNDDPDASKKCATQCSAKFVVGKLVLDSNACNECKLQYRTCADSWYCPNNYQKSGSESNTTCYKTEKVTTYTCPSNANYKEGSGSNLKCYVVTDGKYTYNCNGYSGYTLDGTNCVKTTTTSTCPSGYKLENNKCNKYSTTTKKATSKTTKKTSTEYKWSINESLSGWTRTGKTRLVADKTCNK